MHHRFRRAAVAASLLIPLAGAGPAFAAGGANSPASAAGSPAAAASTATAHHLALPDGSTVRWSDDGTGTLTDAQGRTRTFPVPASAGRTGLGTRITPSDAAVAARAGAGSAPAYRLGATGAAADPAAPVQTMNTGPVPLPKTSRSPLKKAFATPRPPAGSSDLPTNAGLTTSFQSYLNAQGVDAAGAFQDAATYLHALPGAGQIVTNVSIGDLTDQSMADAGDSYVSSYGPTTVVQGGQRYLDIPSMPLIPTYTADGSGHLDPTGSTEGQDPTLGEVLLDFAMMAPLPHDEQRAGATGSDATDLLGIAPGASYRLVVPQQPDYAGIAAALKAAAAQKPRPSVITASLGFGTDESLGFPGRYLEDDPTIHAALTSIVKSGIPVVISSNDGTRLALPVSVGPDGGSTPTDVTRDPGRQTDIDDVTPTTTPSEVVDSGVIAAGSTTLDDTLTSPDVRQGSYPTTRYNGSAGYASGFGSRVDLSAPGDDLPSFVHTCASTCSAEDVEVVLNGGTSATAPMIAAAVADVLQAAKATHQSLTPAQVRDLLVSTARPVTQTPQADRTLHVGPQLDVTAAYEKVLSHRFSIPTSAARLSVAERQVLPTGSGTAFVESTDPSAIDLSGPPDANGTPTGQNAVSPITLGLDLTGSRAGLTYRLRVGDHGSIAASAPSLRVLPTELLKAAGLPVTSDSSRTVHVTFQALRHGTVVASRAQDLTFLPDDGTYAEAQAPALPGSSPLGRAVTVTYDLTGVRGLDDPELVVSSVGHWTPNAAVDIFHPAWTTHLTATKGSVTIPASAFAAGGAGLYGVGIKQGGDLSVVPFYGDFRAIDITPAAGGTARPAAPLLGGGGASGVHAVDVTRTAPKLTVSWDVRGVPGADGAALEVLAPAPTLWGSINTTTNQNGSRRDDDGTDHASTLYRALPSASGHTTLDLASLGLPTSLQYPVRVLATRHGVPVGQASPTSFLQYRDGDQLPGIVEGFSVAGGKAFISTDEFTAGSGTDPYVLSRAATTPYALDSGTAGAPIAQSTAGDLMQLDIGTDAGAGTTLVLHTPFDSSVSATLDVRSTTTGAVVGQTAFDSLPGANGYLEGGAVDAQRHRGFVTSYDPDTGISSLWPVDMRTGKVGTPLALNPQNLGRSFSNVSVDAATGQVFVATTGTMGPCLSGRVPYWAVRADVDAGTVSPVTTLSPCTAGLLPDGKGGTVYAAAGAAQPNAESGTFPDSSWLSMDQATLTPGPAADTGTHGPAWPALDDVHHVVVEASLYEAGADSDNNAMSEITVLDPDTGKVLARHPVANLADSTVAGSDFDFTSRQGLYLDPSHRTGWIVDAWGTGLQRFTY